MVSVAAAAAAADDDDAYAFGFYELSTHEGHLRQNGLLAAFIT